MKGKMMEETPTKYSIRLKECIVPTPVNKKPQKKSGG